jgi:hypothetical protein
MDMPERNATIRSNVMQAPMGMPAGEKTATEPVSHERINHA